MQSNARTHPSWMTSWQNARAFTPLSGAFSHAAMPSAATMPSSATTPIETIRMRRIGPSRVHRLAPDENTLTSGGASLRLVPRPRVVGIGYPGDAPDYGRLRRFDLTPASDGEDDELGTSGHAREFLDVLEQQIIPFVEGRYRVDASYRALAGSSLGGLFALYALFTKPGLFAAYVAASPATPFARGWLFGSEDAFAKTGKPLAARLYMTVAEKESPAMFDGGKRFDARLRAHAYAGLAYEFRVIDGERHSGTKPESFNRGLRFAFAPRAPIPPDPSP
jgi:predicted alpha/beta superfamily hydrolase